jgi:RNA polymerase sigma-70 factor (ECF subfamily)
MENIVAQYETPLLRYAGRILNNPVLAQDIVQNVFVKLFKAWQPGTRPSAQLKGWLYRVTHNEAVDHIRRETRLKDMHMEHAGENSAACADGLNCSMSDDDKMKLALRFIAKLPLRDQQVLLLRLQEGLPYKDIARITGRTTGNVGNILHHAVKRLSAELKQAGIGSVQPDQGANAT